VTSSKSAAPATTGLRHRPAVVAVAMGGMNVALYVFTVVAARLLGPREYGAFASLMAVLIVVAVVQLGIQATAARRISADPEHVGQIEREVLRLSLRTAVVVGGLLLLAAPALDRLLRLDSLLAVGLLALSAVPVTYLGGQLGVLQGERRWWPVAVLYLASGVCRLVAGVGLILWHPTDASAMAGVLVGSLAPVALGAYALRRTRDAGLVSDHHGSRPVAREILASSQTLLAYLVLMNCDVILARNVLDEHAAGLYAAGLILTKAMLFLPQFVVVVAFPSMATAHERRRALVRGLTFILAVGTAGVLACALLPGLALVFVGGDEYAEIRDLLWLFAVLGTVLCLLQLLVYAVLARQGTRTIVLVWIAVLVVLGVGSQQSTVTSLLTSVVVIDSMLFVALLVLSLRRLGSPDRDSSAV
jgi:O-antigen/teichoic acid export membrane protein